MTVTDVETNDESWNDVKDDDDDDSDNSKTKNNGNKMNAIDSEATENGINNEATENGIEAKVKKCKKKYKSKIKKIE